MSYFLSAYIIIVQFAENHQLLALCFWIQPGDFRPQTPMIFIQILDSPLRESVSWTIQVQPTLIPIAIVLQTIGHICFNFVYFHCSIFFKFLVLRFSQVIAPAVAEVRCCIKFILTDIL